MTLSNRHDSRQRIQDMRYDPRHAALQEAISPNAAQAALRVAQSLFFSDS